MTACHESGGFRYDRQVGGGPALSYYQIEPDTLFDLYKNYLGYRPERKGLLDQFLPADSTGPETALMDSVLCHRRRSHDLCTCAASTA